MCLAGLQSKPCILLVCVGMGLSWGWDGFSHVWVDLSYTCQLPSLILDNNRATFCSQVKLLYLSCVIHILITISDFAVKCQWKLRGIGGGNWSCLYQLMIPISLSLCCYSLSAYIFNLNVLATTGLGSSPSEMIMMAYRQIYLDNLNHQNKKQLRKK